MPKRLHEKLKKQAKKKGLSGKNAAAYTYGTLHDYEVRKKSKGRGSNKVAKPSK